MPEARLELTIPEEVWIGGLSRRYPGATFRVLSALPDGQSGVALAEITGESLSDLLDEMAAEAAVTEFAVLNDTDERALVQFETTTPLLLLAARDSGMPLELPFELSDGTALWKVTASSDRLAELDTQLEAFGIPFTIEALRYEVSEEALLTDSQRALVETAIEMGYYDTPRTCSLTDIADEIGRAKSTVSETLHRAEGTILREFVESEA